MAVYVRIKEMKEILGSCWFWQSQELKIQVRRSISDWSVSSLSHLGPHKATVFLKLKKMFCYLRKNVGIINISPDTQL